LDKDSGNLWDKALEAVRKDPSNFNKVLKQHPNERAELEPFLKTAMALDSA
jgi:hypothetical protein